MSLLESTWSNWSPKPSQNFGSQIACDPIDYSQSGSLSVTDTTDLNTLCV